MLLRETVIIAVKNEMVGFELQAVDGTKIIDDVNKDKTLTVKGLKKKLKIINKEIYGIIKKVEENDARDEEDGKGGYGLPEKLRNKEELRKEIQ